MVTTTKVKTARPLTVTTPLGADVLLLTGLHGQEGISQLFSFQLDVLAPSGMKIPFDKLLGQKVTAQLVLPDGQHRHINGLCQRLRQAESDGEYTAYQLEIVPQFWLWTKKFQSRVFQHLPVPEILKKVLEGLEVVYDIRGTFHPRDYCVQYRESDFAFASRLMEEEGIYYFFRHGANAHKLVVANTPQGHPDLPFQSEVIYEDIRGGVRDEDRVIDWEKVQEIRSGKYTLWDHCFELPHKHLEADKQILDAVQVGPVTHKLRVGGNDQLELYDYPGEYAQRFDGVDKGGSDRNGDPQKIFQDNLRTVEIRMQQETVPGLVIRGASTCRQFISGHKFTLATLENGRERGLEVDGPYLLTGVLHSAHCSAGYSGAGGGFDYRNSFTCLPLALPFRPPRATPKPVVQGCQTAVVVGLKDEEIFTDKYGRVKVQFHWDRQGKHDANSSCWVRVGTPWAGKQWGAIHIPRVGQEVIVDFLEGDPDRPIIIGSVYNAEMMPPYKLPDKKTQSGFKTHSTPNGGEKNFNELRFEDKKDSEDIYFHAEKDFHRVVENNDHLKVGHKQTIEIKNDRTETVKEGNETITIEKGDRSVTVQEGEESHLVKKDRTVIVQEGSALLHVLKGSRLVTVKEGADTLKVKTNRKVTVEEGKDELTISQGDQKTKVEVGKIETEAGTSIELKVGDNSIKMEKSGITLKVGESTIKLEQSGVTIKGMQVKIEGQLQTEMKGAMTTVKGDGMLTLKGGVTMIN